MGAMDGGEGSIGYSNGPEIAIQLKYFNFIYSILGEEDDSYMDSDNIVTRSKFPESWQWTDITLGACSGQIPNWLVHWNTHTVKTLCLQWCL